MGKLATAFVRKARDNLRLRDFDTLTSEARSRERFKRVALTAAASAGARGIGIATTLVTLPLTLRYLGPEQYGLWVTITSITALLGFANLGLSNGLVNAVSEAHGKKDRNAARRHVSSAFYMLVGVAAVLGVTFAVTYGFVPWPRVFNVVSPDAAEVAGPAMAVFVAITLVGLPLGVAQGIQAGFQEGFASSGWQGVGSVFSLLGLLIAIAVKADLPWLVLALGGGPVVAALLNGVVLLRRRPWLIPRVRLATIPAVKHMMQFGLMFFILAVAAAVAYQTDNIVIAQLLGPEQVTQYAVPMKLFMIAPLILSFALTPLWPAYGEALARRDHAWVKRTLVRSLLISSSFGIIMSGLLLVLGRPLLHAWAGSTINPTTPLMLALAAWAVANSVTGPIAMLLNGANALRFQAFWASVMMTANIALSIALTRLVGISGPAWGSVVAQVSFVLLPSAIYLRSSFRKQVQEGVLTG
jgi:O-antigen/teichoic acid export membrane protein